MLRNFLITALIFFLSGGIMYVTLTSIDPLGTQKIIGFFLFYISLFLGVSAFFTCVFFFAKELIQRKKLGHRSFGVSVRRGILTSLFITIITLLQMFRILDIYETILLAVFLSLVEYIFITNTKLLTS